MADIEVKDASGNPAGSFQSTGGGNLVDEAAAAGVEIPFSCHAGACTTCAARVHSGAEHIDEEKEGPKYLETEEGVILTCIGGIKDDAPADAKVELELLS